MEILTNAEAIFDNGNKHMSTKFRHIGQAEQAVVKYIIGKLRKYHGHFFEKYKAVAEEVGCSTKTVQRAVKHAEKLEIFQVSERFEKTLEGKMRKTTNLIQLLVFKPFEIIDGILTIVRTVKKAVKLVDMAVKKLANTKPAQAPKKSYKNQNSKPVRTEILPDWFEASQKEAEERDAKKPVDNRTDEQKKAEIASMLAQFRK